MLNRRALMGHALAGSAMLALAACTTTKSGTVTTVTLNVAKVTAYAQAGLNAATTVTDALALFPSLSAYLAPVQAVEMVVQTALANFTSAAGGNLTVSYDNASIKTAVDSVLSAIQSVASEVSTILVAMAKQAALGLSDKTVSKVQLAHDALATIISVFQALLTNTVASMAPQKMSDGMALRVLAA